MFIDYKTHNGCPSIQQSCVCWPVYDCEECITESSEYSTLNMVLKDKVSGKAVNNLRLQIPHALLLGSPMAVEPISVYTCTDFTGSLAKVTTFAL